MSMSVRCTVVAVGILAAASVAAQSQSPARTDVYHVHFTKAVPGQAEALGKALMTPDPSAPMPDHFLLLRHQEGDDWDYAVIQHLGPKAAVTATTAAAAGRDLRAWHTDTFVSGPSWADFTREMGIGAAKSASPVYVLGVYRAVPGHRDPLETMLNQPPAATAKVKFGTAMFQHLEGGDWTFLTLARYDSWQDLATDRAAAAGESQGWADVRQHLDFHRDTIAGRLFPK